MKSSSYVVIGAVLLLSVTGCSSGEPRSASTREAAPPTATSSAAADPGRQACDALSEPVSLSYNAWNDFGKGTIDAATRNEQLTQAATLFEAIDAPAGGIRIAVDNVVAYISASEPSADGQPFDPGTDEFFTLQSSIGSACSAAGHELVANAHGG